MSSKSKKQRRGRRPTRIRRPRSARPAVGRSIPASREVRHAHSQAELDAYLSDGRPTVVDFWAPWCGPCRAIAPLLEATARELGDRVDFVKVNVDEVGGVGARYSIRGIPTLLGFDGTQETQRQVGLVGGAQLREFALSLAPRPAQPEAPEAPEPAEEAAESPDMDGAEDTSKDEEASAAGERERRGEEPAAPAGSGGLGSRIKRLFGIEAARA